MKKFKIFTFLVAMMLVTCVAFAGCGKNANNKNSIKFYVYGTANEISVYQEITNAFNNSVGKEKGITVTCSYFPEDGYERKIVLGANTKSGPDVFLILEKKFKAWAKLNYLEPLDSYLQSGSLNINDIWSETVSRYRYDIEKNISTSTSPLYSLPTDSSPTSLYYNRDLFENAGIIVIGVPEKDIDAWNAGLVADKYGKKKSDYPSLNGVTIPAKGYYRSSYDEDPTYYYKNGSRWFAPENGEILVFNDEIAMNWDETEDLAMLFTKSYNPASSSLYGFYTEWWFNYAWSVGGDCVQDLSGQGDWTFSLGDYSPNYIVNVGKTYTGAITGKVYHENDTLVFLDKLAITKTDVVTADDKGGFKINGVSVGSEQNPDEIISDNVKDAVSSGILTKLPSTKEAFHRFAMIAGQKSNGSLAITPMVSELENKASFSYFLSGNVATIIERASYISEATDASQRMGGFKFGVAPLPIYKEYDEQDNTTVIAHGISSGHSNSISASIRPASNKKDKAWLFMEYLCGEEGQRIKASKGFIPNQRKLVETDSYLRENPHMSVFLQCMDTQKAGDWWYMVDTNWISVWSDPLNGKVRNGTMELDSWFTTYIPQANDKLKGYKSGV